ncbi:MAG: amidohydrolase [Candidatus Neomarinimicrobiota bacterium]|nr:amidohydrolase [Candidatus Neomarinimicrobiota bacterium]|tara:strand:- start:108 stop:1799 length:1692 start_codon:yes stop_codon:yes gene_type:complete
MKVKLILALIMLFTVSCEAEKADMIIHNGTIYTMNDFMPTAEAVAVINGKVAALGKYKDLDYLIGPKTKIINLNGAMMTPGLIEGHGHFYGLGLAKMQLDLSTASSYDELVNMVSDAVDQSSPGQWILGRGWHQSKWSDSKENFIKGFQTHDSLSEISPNNPVWLKHASGHAGFANQKAMDIAGVSSETEFGFGGEIIKDLSGNPTGVFNERAQGLINKYVDSNLDENSDLRAIELAVKACLENGITSFHDAGTGNKTITTLREAIANNLLRVRIYAMLTSGDTLLLNQWYKKGPEIGTGNDFLTIRSIKLNADGALGSRGAWLLNEYADRPGHYGMATQSMDYVYTVAKKGIQSGFQVNSHAIGDRANREILNQYEKVFNEFPEMAKDHRWRIEHAQHIDPADIPRFGRLKVIPSIQGIHMSSDRPWAINRLGQKRIVESAYVWRSLINHGAILINGSDVPVEPIDPIASFYASTTRKTLKGLPDSGYEPEQKMTRIEALKSYTINAAYGAFEEKLKGSIEIGKYADFAVFSQNLVTIPDEKILNTKVLYTIVNGNIEYQAN